MKVVIWKSFKSKSGVIFLIRCILRDDIFSTLDGATIETYCGKIFSWASSVYVNGTQTTYDVSRGIRWQFFVFQIKSESYALLVEIESIHTLLKWRRICDIDLTILQTSTLHSPVMFPTSAASQYVIFSATFRPQDVWTEK